MPPVPASRRHRTAAALAAGGAVAAGLCWRRFTTPFPYSQRWMLDKELPLLTRPRLLAELQPSSGEHVLEIGPGTGLFSLPVARALGEAGRLEIFDIQHEMLDHTMRAAERCAIHNLSATQGDARRLPYADASFDAAYLVTVIGEIPDMARALEELRRVLRPGGRLVVGEFLIDWHGVPLALLRRRAARAGLRFEHRSGSPVSYLARFAAV